MNEEEGLSPGCSFCLGCLLAPVLFFVMLVVVVIIL